MKEQKNLFKKTDDAIMYAVNRCVKAWNYTTGKTKTDLANRMLCVAPILESVGATMSISYFRLIIAPLVFQDSYKSIKINKKFERLEEKSINNNCKSILVEGLKEGYKKAGAIGLFLATPTLTGFAVMSSNKRAGGPALFCAGCAIRSFSDYVMRAEYLPPRKSVFKRAKEKLAEKLQQTNLNPFPIPEPQQVPIRVLNNCLEDYLVR